MITAPQVQSAALNSFFCFLYPLQTMVLTPIAVNDKDVRHPAVNTAMEVFKGALAEVLKIPSRSTIGINFPEIGHVRMTVFTGRSEPVTEEEFKQIVDLSNAKVAENVACTVVQMTRQEAEAQYGQAIYDKINVRRT